MSFQILSLIGYLIGNVSPARMDFRWFLVGDCITILSSLATPAQATAIMDLIEERWENLIGEVPLKIPYPALDGHEWRIVTGYDPKNTWWSYHKGGSWPVLLWLLTAASIKTGGPQIVKWAIELAEHLLTIDGWPEYYDGKTGRYVGKQARKCQTWSIAGYLFAKMMVENPSNLLMISRGRQEYSQAKAHPLSLILWVHERRWLQRHLSSRNKIATKLIIGRCNFSNNTTWIIYNSSNLYKN